MAGIGDYFRSRGLLLVGPNQKAAALEGSKAFAKDFMRRHGIPTAAYEVFEDPDLAEKALASGTFEFPVVLKADGLAAGKGVYICNDLKNALSALNEVMRQRRFGESGRRLVIEEYLKGEEISFMVFTDGEHAIPMVPSQDHKAIYDNDKGPNTGGMGAYSIDALVPPSLQERIMKEVIVPALQGMSLEGRTYQGILYAGLMMTAHGPRVLEFNARFGDPETQVVLTRLQSDLLPILQAMALGNIQSSTVEWKPGAGVCVVLAAEGYPGSYESGKEISGLEMAAELTDTVLFHAGTTLSDSKILTSGGRVLGVCAHSGSLEAAIMKAYDAVNRIHFEGMYYRKDIGLKGLPKERGEQRL